MATKEDKGKSEEKRDDDKREDNAAMERKREDQLLRVSSGGKVYPLLIGEGRCGGRAGESEEKGVVVGG